MRVLIAISSCWDYEQNGSNQVLRDTWLADAEKTPGLDYRFFFGSGQGAENEERTGDFLPHGCNIQTRPKCVFLDDVDDGYGDLSRKTQHSLRWASVRGYDFVFRCFPDTYCRPERLASCGFRDFDYYGDFRREHCGPDNYPSGGPGYFLSRKAFELLLDAPIEGVHRVSTYAEDLWAGQILNRHRDKQLRYFDDASFVNHGTRAAGPLKSNTLISTHLSCPDRYHPGRMQEKHEQWMASQ